MNDSRIVMLCAIWYDPYNLENVENTREEVLLCKVMG